MIGVGMSHLSITSAALRKQGSAKCAQEKRLLIEQFAQAFFGKNFSISSMPKVVHVVAVRAEERQLRPSTPADNLLIQNMAEDGKHSIRTIDTSCYADMHRKVKVDTADDFFLLNFFRAAASHVLTSANNLRLEKDLHVGIQGPFADELSAFRRWIGVSNATPTPVILSGSGDVDFAHPIFLKGCVNSEAPILLTALDRVESAKARLAKTSQSSARIIGVDPQLLSPSFALKYCLRELSADRVSVECGPSISSELHCKGHIDALSLSILRCDDWRSMEKIPVVGVDTMFNAESPAISRTDEQCQAIKSNLWWQKFMSLEGCSSQLKSDAHPDARTIKFWWEFGWYQRKSSP